MSFRPLRLGGLKIWPPVILAPMAGYTDRVFRAIVRDLGCPFAYTEMASAHGLLLGGDDSRAILKRAREDRPLAVQIFGKDPQIMAKASEMIGKLSPLPQAIDINMGCPARKITSSGAGSALLKDLPLALAIVSAVKSATSLPVTVKMRAGWDSPIDVPSFVGKLSEAGADMVAVHGRTAMQGYCGKVHWDLIGAAAQNSPVPVVGNGGVVTAQNVREILSDGLAHGVMVGRAALINPFIFEECKAALEGTPFCEAGNEKRLKISALHFEKSIDEYGQRNGLLKMRKHLIFSVKGLPNATKIRSLISKETSPGKILNILLGGWKVI